MDEIISCPSCHQSPPPSTSLSSQIILYLKTLILPPFGFFWGYQYLRQPDAKSKLIGILVVVITIIEIILLIQSTINMINIANLQMSQQLNVYNSSLF